MPLMFYYSQRADYQKYDYDTIRSYAAALGAATFPLLNQ